VRHLVSADTSIAAGQAVPALDRCPHRLKKFSAPLTLFNLPPDVMSPQPLFSLATGLQALGVRTLASPGLCAALGLLAVLSVPPSAFADALPTTSPRARLSAPSTTTVRATSGLPPAVSAILRASGLPAKSFAFDVHSVQSDHAAPLLELNADEPFLLASTAKLVTSLAALDLLGPQHRWRTMAYAKAPLVDGRLAGDLVIVGGQVGLTGNELRRWFVQMRAEGLQTIDGNIVLEDVALLHERDPKQSQATDEERAPDAPMDGAAYNRGRLLVTVGPGDGDRALVTLTPRPSNVMVVNDVLMGESCAASARWKRPDEIDSGPALQLWVRGRWKRECEADAITYVTPPPGVNLEPALGAAPALPIAAPAMVGKLWAEAGGALRGRVVEREAAVARPRAPRWSSELATPVGEVLREMNKTSNNEAARSVLLSLAPGAPGSGALPAAQRRIRAWLVAQGLRDGDITLEVGSGQSRAERGKPRAMVELLRNAWRSANSQTLIDSLPIAGVDGTLVHRMLNGRATGHAFLKTGTLSDTRALAGYVRARSGQVYAVSMMVTDPRAAGSTSALDALIEWIAQVG
jgi:D-alanyl-D-alanine carboxypeptidase/D-alanyl-D-alanine-endopeptidase (penicillin-binding protein 4)